MRIAIASDHAGIQLKKTVVEHLRQSGVEVHDAGPLNADSVDYPRYARPLAEGVARGDFELGILVCGTGTGMSLAANKVHGVRAANCTNEVVARYARLHNDVNVLCLGERIVGATLAIAIVDTFVGTAFEGGRHQRRVDLIHDIEAGVALKD